MDTQINEEWLFDYLKQNGESHIVSMLLVFYPANDINQHKPEVELTKHEAFNILSDMEQRGIVENASPMPEQMELNQRIGMSRWKLK